MNHEIVHNNKSNNNNTDNNKVNNVLIIVSTCNAMHLSYTFAFTISFNLFSIGRSVKILLQIELPGANRILHTQLESQQWEKGTGLNSQKTIVQWAVKLFNVLCNICSTKSIAKVPYVYISFAFELKRKYTESFYLALELNT